MKPSAIQVLIVDDEPLAREGIRLLLQAQSDMRVVGECGTGIEALEFLRKHKVDLIFLDVQMPEMTGIQMLAHLERRSLPAIIFVTAYDQYALEAFRVHAVDYLMKPFTDEQFGEALERARHQIQAWDVAGLEARLAALLNHMSRNVVNPTSFLTRISIPTAGRTEFVKTADIDWIEAADYYVEVHVGSRAHLLRETMNRLEEQLDPSRFVRIHRSTIVNIDRIHAIEPYFKGDYCVALKDGKKLKVSKNRYEKLKEVLASSPA